MSSPELSVAERVVHHMPTTRDFPVKISTDQGILVLTITEPRVQGEEVAEILRQEMLAALERSGARQVVVDFQHALYISSAAFRPLLSLRRKLQETNGRIVLCGLSKAIGDVFYTTQMISDTGSVAPLFEMQKDVPSAIAHLQATAQS
jgi:anti-anti-sigma factor